MSNEIEYDDGRAVLDRNGVTLRRYYFPTGQSKHIPYRQIHAAEVRPMGWLTGKGRGWGSAHPRYWLPSTSAGCGRTSWSCLTSVVSSTRPSARTSLIA
jgi:hypothetical protein